MNYDPSQGCAFAGPGRGDCFNFLGLPGKSIPNQHDGPDDTVDVYGKPNGWCWSCWKAEQITRLEKRNYLLKQLIPFITNVNADNLTPVIREALSLVNTKEWKEFFDNLRQEQYNLLTSTPNEDLTSIKHKVMIIDELEQLFQSTK